MAAILVYAGVKGYKKYQAKRCNSTSGEQNKSRKNRKSISSLVLPSVASANIVPGGENFTDDLQLPQYELYEEKASLQPANYTAPYSPDSIRAPTRTAPPPPVMLGLTLCESPVTPSSELESELGGDPPIDLRSRNRNHLQSDSLIDRPSDVFVQVLDYDEVFPEPLSPAPLHVVKRRSSPLPPPEEELETVYSSDESEEIVRSHRDTEGSTYLEVPMSNEELLDFEPPPIPPKSPARRLRLVSN
jgi:hypothetical protein